MLFSEPFWSNGRRCLKTKGAIIILHHWNNLLALLNIHIYTAWHSAYSIISTMQYAAWLCNKGSSEGILTMVKGRESGKVIYTKYSKHWHCTVAHTKNCVCSKMFNDGLNHGLFPSLFKLIPNHVHWIVYAVAYLNFIIEF